MLKSIYTRIKTLFQRVKLYDKRRGRNGKIWFKSDWIYFQSHTEKGFDRTGYKFKKSEVMTHLFKGDDTSTKEFSFDFCVDKWIPMNHERDGGTFGGGKLKGCFAVICQLHNERAAPRAYLTLHRKRLDSGKLSENNFTVRVQNKDDTGKVADLHTFETSLGKVNSVKFVGNRDEWSYTFNGEVFKSNLPYLTPPKSTVLQFGIYADGNMFKTAGLDVAAQKGLGPIIKFRNLEFKR